MDFSESTEMTDLRGTVSAPTKLDQAIQTHGGNGLATDCGPVPMWAVARLLRVAPVNREMILNQTAQHSLHLLRSD